MFRTEDRRNTLRENEKRYHEIKDRINYLEFGFDRRFVFDELEDLKCEFEFVEGLRNVALKYYGGKSRYNVVIDKESLNLPEWCDD